jgi:hypothetical protein
LSVKNDDNGLRPNIAKLVIGKIIILLGFEVLLTMNSSSLSATVLRRSKRENEVLLNNALASYVHQENIKGKPFHQLNQVVVFLSVVIVQAYPINVQPHQSVDMSQYALKPVPSSDGSIVYTPSQKLFHASRYALHVCGIDEFKTGSTLQSLPVYQAVHE